MGYKEQFISVFHSILYHLEMKIAGGVLVSFYSFFFSVDLYQVMMALVALVTIDLVMGILASKKSGEQIESRGVLTTAFKFGVYGMLISAGHLTDVALGISSTTAWVSAETAMIGYLAVAELVSITENAGRMGYSVPQRLLNQLKTYQNTKSS